MAPEVENWQWLRSTYTLQSRTYGYPLSTLQRGAQVGAPPEAAGPLSNYLDWNVTAAVQELAEVREEFSWKPWATDKPFVNRDRILAECVDVCHFIGNILVGIGINDEEWEEAYKRKQDINRSRASSGVYSARKGGLAMGSD